MLQFGLLAFKHEDLWHSAQHGEPLLSQHRGNKKSEAEVWLLVSHICQAYCKSIRWSKSATISTSEVCRVKDTGLKCSPLNSVYRDLNCTSSLVQTITKKNKRRVKQFAKWHFSFLDRKSYSSGLYKCWFRALVILNMLILSCCRSGFSLSSHTMNRLSAGSCKLFALMYSQIFLVI